MDRRRFLATTAAVAAAGPSLAAEDRKGPGPICFFSKHLPTMTPRAMARRLRAAGFDGIELTVRPGGHVSPEAVETELPKAIAAIREEGLDVPIIATAVTSADDRTLAPILTTAAKLGIRLFRPGWFTYALDDVRKELRQAGQALARLTEAARKARVELAYQNHVGNLGAAVWDLDSLIEPLDKRWAGIYFDIRHAAAEGSAGSWKLATHLVAPRVKVFSVKDFYWQRDPKGAWVTKDCPLGTGMVDVRTPLEILAKRGFHGPITVFLEYEPEGGKGDDQVLAAAARDLKYLKARVAEVYRA
jgi:L-ribulose-5-phosphate 3-epimerase